MAKMPDGEKVSIQLLISAVSKEPKELIRQMNIETDAILINQCDKNGFEEICGENFVVKAYDFAERGVGLSRNNALLRADHEISVFSDEDIVYVKGYSEIIEKAFGEHPEADMLLFNVDVCPERRTYHIDSFSKIGILNCGRYPSYSFAVKTEQLHRKNITFSLLFGGGAKYSNGEDSLFIMECIKKGMKVYAVPETIGKEVPRESTWFKGYNEKFFFDRGVLYAHLYGKYAKPLGLRFVYKHKGEMCKEIPWKRAYAILKKGIKEGRT